MPAPIAVAPLAFKLIQLGGAAAIGAYVASRRGDAPLDAGREDALDAVPEGALFETRSRTGEARADAAGRWRRIVRLGRDGPGLEVDLAAMGRLRLRRR